MTFNYFFNCTLFNALVTLIYCYFNIIHFLILFLWLSNMIFNISCISFSTYHTINYFLGSHLEDIAYINLVGQFCRVLLYKCCTLYLRLKVAPIDRWLACHLKWVGLLRSLKKIFFSPTHFLEVGYIQRFIRATQSRSYGIHNPHQVPRTELPIRNGDNTYMIVWKLNMKVLLPFGIG